MLIDKSILRRTLKFVYEVEWLDKPAYKTFTILNSDCTLILGTMPVVHFDPQVGAIGSVMATCFFFDLALTDRNMEVRFFFEGVNEKGL